MTEEKAMNLQQAMECIHHQGAEISKLNEENTALKEGISQAILSLNETITEQRSGLINRNGVRLKLAKIVKNLIKLKKS